MSGAEQSLTSEPVFCSAARSELINVKANQTHSPKYQKSGCSRHSPWRPHGQHPNPPHCRTPASRSLPIKFSVVVFAPPLDFSYQNPILPHSTSQQHTSSSCPRYSSDFCFGSQVQIAMRSYRLRSPFHTKPRAIGQSLWTENLSKCPTLKYSGGWTRH